MTAVYYKLAFGTFLQDWSNLGMIDVEDDWSGVDSIVGYLGDYTSTAPANVDPRTLDSEALGQADVLANQLSPMTLAYGGVAEFEIANPTIALQASALADSPSIVVYLDATGRHSVQVQAALRDLDGDSSVQQFNVQYRTDPGGDWIDVPGGYFADVSGAGASMATMVDVLLPEEANDAATLEVRFVTTNAGGNDEWVGVDDIRISSQPILPPNQAPVDLVIDDAAVDENAPAGTAVGTVSAFDADGNVLGYSLADDAGGRFAIDAATGVLTTEESFDHEAQASYDIVVRATDPEGLFVERTLTIAVADGNDAPAGLVADLATVAENMASGALVGTVAAVDQDGDALSYSLVDDAGGRFAIDAETGVVTTAASFDFEARASYAIVVRAADPTGAVTERTVTVAIGDVNEAPEGLVIDNAVVAENRVPGTLVGIVAALDPDGGALAYSLADDAGGRFAIDAATGALTAAASFDREEQASYDIVVRASDTQGLSVERTLTIEIANVNEGPTGLVIDDAALEENEAAGSLVGTVRASDPDGDTLSYSLADDAGGLFAIDASTGALTAAASLDHEAQASYDIVVRASDADGLSVERTLTIEVVNVNEAPGSLVIDQDKVAENLPAGTLVGTVGAGDPDGDTLTYSLVDDDGGRFAIDAATGAVTTTQILDFEAVPSHAILVRAADAGGLSTERTLIISVADAPDASAPPVAAGDVIAANEDATTPNLWEQLLGNDSGDTLAIAAVDTTGTRGSLVFDAAGETLRYVASHDSFDDLAPGETFVDSFAYTVTDRDGRTSTATVSVTVTGVADGVVRFAPLFGGTLHGTDGEDLLTGFLGRDSLYGEGGHDILFGGLGEDRLFGGDGNDYLVGGLHGDRLDGGAGNDDLNGGLHDDVLIGGSGADRFHAELAGGKDVVLDFEAGVDSILLDWGVRLRGSKLHDADHDGDKDLVLNFTGGATLTLLDIEDIAMVTFAATDDLSGLPLF